MGTASGLWSGRVGHTRRDDRGENAFTYGVAMALLDLDELEAGALDCWPVFSSVSPWALLAFRRRDHMLAFSDALPLSETVRNFVQKATGSRPEGPIKLLTNLVSCGIGFNPVSFYYVMDRTGAQVEAVVEEVNNIPWFEQHCYLMLPEDPTADPQSVRGFGWRQKQFHVSPFIENTTDISYHWSFSPPKDSIYVRGKLVRDSTPFFHAFLDLPSRRPFTLPSLLRLLVAYPLSTVRIIALIHYNAAKLWFRNYTFYPYKTDTKTSFLSAVESAASLVMRLTGKTL